MIENNRTTMGASLQPARPGRIELVDSLRGFALMAIVILHCIEHYNIFAPLVPWEPAWLVGLDGILKKISYFLISGKAYATFSILFGFSFYIQFRNARARGDDFRLRFAWRMLLLACFAQLHALFYDGDILLFYAVCGLVLIPAVSWKDRTVLVVALILLLQPLDWFYMALAAIHPGFVDQADHFLPFALQAQDMAMHGGFWQTLRSNITVGQLFSNLWQIDAGRICQAPGLFLLGMWLGRKEMFVPSETSLHFWRSIFRLSVPAGILLWLFKQGLGSLDLGPTWKAHIGIATGFPFNIAVMAFLVSGFSLLWFHKGDGYRFQRLSIPFGRMSLTNYIAQSMIGVTIFFHFGLGLYRYCGTTLSMLIALGIITLLSILSRLWLKRHRQGPLEWLWKRLTWLPFPGGGVAAQTIDKS